MPRSRSTIVAASHRHADGRAGEIAVKGRVIGVPRPRKGVARFSLRRSLRAALGASDYLRIAREFHTLILDDIPVMDYPQRDEAKRFIALIDTLYDNAVKLSPRLPAEPAALYRATDGYEAFDSTAPPRASSRCARTNTWLCRTATMSAAPQARPQASSRLWICT